MTVTVAIAGATIDPCNTVAQVTVIHGRHTFADGPTPSSATVQIVVPPGPMPNWQGGDTLVITRDVGPLFSGRVTDQAINHDQDGATFTITASGALARLGVRVVGDEPWPQETGTARATRILTLAGTAWAVDGAVDYAILPRDVDAQPALGLLANLAADTSAAVFDTPAGVVVYQPLSGRDRPVVPFMWQDFPVTLGYGEGPYGTGPYGGA